MSDTRTVAALPAIVAVLGRSDAGEYGAASCPHCGADGRYVFRFLCADGTTRGAMSGCIKLFPRDRIAALLEDAFGRQADLKPGQRLASWWTDMIQAASDLESGRVDLLAFRASVQRAETMRQAWLKRKGFARYGTRLGAR